MGEGNEGGVSRSPIRQAGRGPVPFPGRDLRWGPLRSKYREIRLFYSVCVVEYSGGYIDLSSEATVGL